MMELQHPPSLKRVRALKVSSTRRFMFTAVAVAIYAVVLPMCYITAGQPRATAIEQIKTMEEARPAGATWGDGVIDGEIPGEDDSDDEVDALLPDPDLEINVEIDKASTTSDSNDLKELFKEHKLQSEIKGKDGRSLPSPWLPSALSCVGLFLALTGTALFFLLCHWLVGFKAWALYEPLRSDEMVKGASTWLMIEPVEHRGKPAICPVKQFSHGGLGVIFQRQSYDFYSVLENGYKQKTESCADSGLASGGVLGAIVLVSCPVANPVQKYVSAKGLNDKRVEFFTERYGRNDMKIPTPKIVDLFKQQLMKPLAIFQIFCAILWMLDEYWQYTIFTLFSIVALEATTCFQRMKTFSTLGGMANKATALMVYRNKSWVEMTTEDLLPGDLISLTRKIKAVSGPSKPNPRANAAAAGQTSVGGANATPAQQQQKQRPRPMKNNDVVPCDMLLLTGSAVVNEASLTGESVPQMKDAIKFDPNDPEEGQRPLDIEGRDRVHTLYSGTNLVVVSPPSSADGASASSSLKRGKKSKAGGAEGGNDDTEEGGRSIISTPDGGCLCYVLRTGFSSSQGELMQMIEFSTEQVSADSKETGLALLVLLCFALASAGYVLKKGLEKGDRTTHELLLKCVIIVTSVVPRQLPVQMAMAVNTALMALMKAGIFCTEPFRVPSAGKINHCLFDKTGTLTTDQLVPVGVVNNMAGSRSMQTPRPKVDVRSARPEAALILGTCHSLVEVIDDGGDSKKENSSGEDTKPSVIGDPIEIAALKGVEWRYDASSQVATPGNWQEYQKPIDDLCIERDKLGETAKNARAKLEARIKDLEHAMTVAKKRAGASPIKEAKILHRHHFSSELQRMSVVCDVVTTQSESSSSLSSTQHSIETGRYCLVKGSPEALKPLLKAENVPEWYDSSYNALAEEGMRVLALAYRRVTADDAASVAGDASVSEETNSNRPEENRKWVESALEFAGFIAFTCKTRADSPTVIRALLESAHGVSMLTGDAPLTAQFVARGIGLCTKPGAPLTLRRKSSGGGDAGGGATNAQSPTLHDFEWVGILAKHKEEGSEGYVKPVPLQVPGVKALSEKHDLIVLESVLDEASAAATGGGVGDSSGDSPPTAGGGSAPSDRKRAALDAKPAADDIYSEVDAIRVFARCSPQGKAKIIRCLQKNDPENHVLMCGDGGNDVGALKQADVGLALLSGYGNANTTDTGPADAELKQLEGKRANNLASLTDGSGAAPGGPAAVGSGLSKSAEEELNKQALVREQRRKEATRMRKVLLDKKKQELMKNQQQMLQEELANMKERGEDTGIMGMAKAAQNVAQRVKVEMQKENAEFNKKHGNLFDASTGSKGDGVDGLDDPLAALDDALPIVRPGDASVAAPFTSRTPSVLSVVTLIRQGRCTLLSALQQQQIMMLECIISAYALSALSLEGARSSERQMMASGWLIMTASLAFSYTKHVDEMHPCRPLRRLFHPAVFFSMLGQAAIHVFCMGYGVSLAKEEMGEDALKEVLDFFKKAKAKELPEQLENEDDPWAEIMSMWQAPFKPNLLNTVVFLVETSQMIAVLFVNYKGRPWMKGILENHPLFLSVFLCIAGVAACAWGFSPYVNSMIHLEAFPDDKFRWQVMFLVFLSIGGTFIWDRLVTAIFAPKVFKAMIDEGKKTTFKDVLPLLKTAGMVAGGLFVLANGSILMLGGLGWWWYKKKQADEAAAL